MKIDKIYIVSLDGEKPEMQNKVLDGLQTLNFEGPTGYEIHPAWNGHTQGVPEGYGVYEKWNLGDNTKNDWWKRDVIPGEVGCMVSHIHIWERIVAEGLDRVLILEDDFNPLNKISDLEEPTEDFDIAYLGRWKISKNAKEKSIGGSWVIPSASYCTHAYVVTLEGAKKLLNDYKIKQNLIPADEFLASTYTKHRRPDIAALFPPTIKAIAVNKEAFIAQKRKQEDSTIEIDPTQNPNLMKKQKNMKNKEVKEPYFEILDTADWEAWKEKYVNNGMLRGEFDLMVDDLTNNIYEFPLFTEKFCKEAVALSEALDKWTIDRHEHYPTNDVLLQDIGLQDVYHRVLKEVVYPLCIHLWTLEGKGWKDMFSENFLARYTTDRQSHLSLHHDFSHVTMVVKLNDEFDGGGTWFPKYNILSNPERVGVATLHPGMVTHLHGARPIYAGKRYICVSFMRKEG
jgi:GR25 family glycosyltransferase involved in LPS biosynthesis